MSACKKSSDIKCVLATRRQIEMRTCKKRTDRNEYLQEEVR
jgi:hypothetical protein